MFLMIVSIIKLLILTASFILVILWINNPDVIYEPVLALLGLILSILEIIRRKHRASNLLIFLSVGTTYTKEQEEYVKEFERYLEDHNCHRLVVGRDCPASRQPILQVRDLIFKSDAVVVLAFTRYIINSAIEKPRANWQNHQESKIKFTRYPTVWNQIEAAIAFGLHRPLLVIVEEGLKQEAMLKDRLEFKTIVTKIDNSFFNDPEFDKIFSDFTNIAKRRSWFRL